MDTKSLTKRLAVAGGLTLATLAQAQDIYYLFQFDPPWGSGSALYASWADWPGNPSEVNFTALYTGDFATSGLEVTSTIGGYGSGYADLNGGTGVTFYPNENTALATNDTLCILSFTVNPTPSMAGESAFYTNYNWIGIQFYPNLDSGPTTFLPALYSGWNNPGNSNGMVWSGSNVTLTVNMAAEVPNFSTYTVGGTNHFYGGNIGVAPSVIHNDPNGSGGPPYDITFNSITFAAPPATPPNLSVSFVAPNIVISWPDPNTNTFTLYQSANINPNVVQFSWSPWAFAPVWNNGTNTVTIPPPFSQALFFQLGNSNLQ
jgi:hypothetical protein